MDPRQEWIDAMYRAHRQATLLVAYHLLHDAELAEDITQDAFALLMEKYEQVKDHADVRKWLAKAVQYLVKNEQRKAYHVREVPMGPEDVPSVEDSYFRGLSSSLPPDLRKNDRDVLCMCFEADLPQEECAERLGCSVEAFRMRLTRAKSRYRKLLEKNSS